MVLKFETNLFNNTDIFKISPEDGQALLFYGSRRLPSDTTQTFDLSDDFNSEITDPNKWGESASGTSTITSTNSIIKLYCPNNNDIAYIYGLTSWSLASISKIELTARVKQTLHANADNQIMIGFTGATANPTIDRAMFMSLTTTSDEDDMDYVTTKDSTTTTTDGELTNGDWHTVKIVVTSSDVKFYVDGILQATHTTNIPDDIGLFPYFRLLNSDAANEDYQLEIDYCRVKVN